MTQHSRLEHRLRFVGVTFVAAFVAVCCSPQRASVNERILVGWVFDPEPGEARVVERELEALLTRRPGADSVVDGALYRFNREGQQLRYLLVRSEGSMIGERSITLYVLAPGIRSDPISLPYETGVADRPGWFLPRSVADVDGDSLPDFEFCAWPERKGEPEIRAMGYRGAWYVVGRHQAKPEGCPYADVGTPPEG